MLCYQHPLSSRCGSSSLPRSGRPSGPECSPAHHGVVTRRRVPDRVVFDHVIAALVHGNGYECLASPGCSDRTIRRRLAEWAQAASARSYCASDWWPTTR